MQTLEVDEVAERAGVDREAVTTYVEVGVVTPDERDRFRPSDVARVRLVAGLVEAGLSLEDLRAAIEDRRLSLDFVDLLMPEPVRLVRPPADASGLAYEDAIGPILASRRPREDLIREDDLEILGLVARAVEMGAPLERVVRIVRAIGLAASKLVELQREFVDEVLLEPAIERTGSPIAALESTATDRYEYRDLGRRLSAVMMERFVDDAIFRNLVQLTEAALDAGGVGSPMSLETMVFVDVSDYTRLSERHGDATSARQAARLIDFVHDLAKPLGASLVKSLGDGAMLHAPDPVSGLELALEAVAGAEQAGLWPLHAGVNAGPMVRRDGDYYGTAVNIASRVADRAGSGEVVVTRPIVDANRSRDVRFHPLGPVALKNVQEPTELFRAERTGPA